MAMASKTLGWLSPRSMFTIACRETPHWRASASCERPMRSRTSRILDVIARSASDHTRGLYIVFLVKNTRHRSHRTLFIATANEEKDSAAPLRDRMRLIHVPAYSREQQAEIGLMTSSRGCCGAAANRGGCPGASSSPRDAPPRRYWSGYRNRLGRSFCPPHTIGFRR